MVVLQLTVGDLLFLAFPTVANTNDIEITVVKVSTLPNLTAIAIYSSSTISLTLLRQSLIKVLENISSQ